MTWPALPEEGFIAGRIAENSDVGNGQAVFSLNGQSAGIIDIAIPQYALWKDEDGSEHPVIVVQAERAPDGTEIVGLLLPDGSQAVATISELTLLGQTRPDQ